MNGPSSNTSFKNIKSLKIEYPPPRMSNVSGFGERIEEDEESVDTSNLSMETVNKAIPSISEESASSSSKESSHSQKECLQHLQLRRQLTDIQKKFGNMSKQRQDYENKLRKASIYFNLDSALDASEHFKTEFTKMVLEKPTKNQTA